MARFRRPQDPQQQNLTPPNSDRLPFPWLWLLLGFIVTGVAIAVALWFVDTMLTREPLPVAAPPPAPTIIRLTAPPTQEPTVTSVQPTPTSIPTLTPSPTPDRADAPAEITVGFFGQVVGTDGIGLSIREGASTVNEILFVAPDETPVLISDGPIENNGFIWWQVQTRDGIRGWAVTDFLEPAAEPADWPRP